MHTGSVLPHGVCSSWLRGRDPSMTLESFQNLWCHNGVLASIRTVQCGTGEKLELICDLSASYPVGPILVMHTSSVLPHWVLIRLFNGIALPCHVFYVTVLNDTFSLLLLTFWTWV